MAQKVTVEPKMILMGARERSADIWAWAKDQGIAVSERGRIPASVVEQYEAAAKRP